MSYKEKILELRSKGYTYNQIVNEVGCAKSTVSYYCKGYSNPNTGIRYDYKEIQEFHDKGNSRKKIVEQFKISYDALNYAIKKGIFIPNPTVYNKDSLNKYSKEEVYCKGSKISRKSLKERVLRDLLFDYKCEWCNVENEWNNKELILELDHINGDNSDNRIENLRLLCPNCHSQTKTFRGRQH